MSDFPHLRENLESIWDDLRWPSWLEIAVIVAICAIVYAISLPVGYDAAIQARVDANVAVYNDALAPTIVPDARILAAKFDCSGQWRRKIGRTGPYVEIEKVGSSMYRARFESGTCQGACRYPRDSTFAGGMLLLEPPVGEYLTGDTFRRLYGVRIGERRFLVPENDVVNFEKALSKDRTEIIDLDLANRSSYRPLKEDE